jgi:signal transduction histidine kinase
MTGTDNALPLKAAGAYLIFGTLWILISDKVLHLMLDQEEHLHGVQTLKGILFVLLSALLIFGVIGYEVSRRRKKELELARAHDQIKERAVQASEEERNRISAELHDGIQQELAGISLMIERIKDERGKEDLGQLQKEVQNCVQEVRSISHDLSSFHVEKKGLKAALEGLPAVNRKGERIELDTELELLDREPLSYFSSLNLYRITQELFLNVNKHSSAERVYLGLEKENEGNLIYRFRETPHRKPKEEGLGFGEYSLQKRIDCLDGTVIHNPEEEKGREFAFRFHDHWLSEEKAFQKEEKVQEA